LQAAAIASGLVDEVGQDAEQAIMAADRRIGHRGFYCQAKGVL